MAVCCVCMREYTADRPKQTVCSVPCSLTYVVHQKKAARDKAQRASDKDRKQALKSMTDLASDAQTEFNRFIRERDKHVPCISCGQSSYQGQRHASHYRSRAAAPQLRFDAYNVHASCAQCNSMKSGNVVEFRIALLKKIGPERVEAIECNNGPANFTREYLLRVKDVFRRRTKHLQKLRAIIRDDGF